MSDLEALIQEELPRAVALRHRIHAEPELSFREDLTAARILERLEALGGLTIRRDVARTGIVAVLNADRDGPCVALRADMDALPMAEQTDLPYASKHEGIMHACGHDGHVACLVATAAVLRRIREELPGKVKFIFQPAEEGGAGAKVMCDEGALENPKVDALFALHAWSDLPVGSILVRPGTILAGSSVFKVTICGQGAHAAQPHRGVDPIVAGAHVVTALQAVVSRFTDPVESLVVTVGQFHAGTAENIIPETCQLHGTIRALSPDAIRRAADLVRQIAVNTANAFGAQALVEFSAGYPVTVNDPSLAAFVAEVGRDVLGREAVVTEAPPTMGTEDFAYYAQRVPAVMFRLGTRPAGASDYPSGHNPRYDFNDDAMPVGIRMLCEICRRYLTGAKQQPTRG